MKILTVDTSTIACSVALTAGDRLVSSQLVNVSGHQSTRVVETIDSVLRSAGMPLEDVDGFGVALGPGSFTGLRVGIATVKGLALATGKPVVGFSSLAMLALNVPESTVPVCPMFDARKKEVYAGLYQCHGGEPVPVIPDCVAPPARFLDLISGPAVFVGEGAVTYREVIVDSLGDRALFAPFPYHQPSAAQGAFLAREAFAREAIIPLHALAPHYIRPSEAELAKMKKEQL